MEHTVRSGTSGVTVEYTDPSSVFADIEPLLKNRLPLRNLHWKSPSRPLRSIESLHVNLVQGKEKRPTSDPTGGAAKQRRHQIPGLRQTPYLKIYFLRCDDNETYKTTSRKLIREWLKENTPSSQSSSSVNNQEHHDAFEWLIVQVVYPDTPAANLSRSSSTASVAKASNEKLGSTKWPGRGSSTVFEKIKADFNGSSKSSQDRVAQIRLPRSSSQPQSRPAGVEVREHDEPWGDLTDKLKSLILTSFDLRVSQYEEDIREKDSQRNLPGWNFCTFFILKEGLARGFENVGLFEDALIGYDELAIGLDVIIRDQGDGSENATGGTFLNYSESLRKDLLDKLNNETSDVVNGSTEQSTTLKIMQEEYPLNVDQKPYRELILASNISIFDVRVYIFARQLTLLLKAANATSLLTAHGDSTAISPSAGLGKEFDAEDLLTLAEACRRATDFISIGARSLRNDLESGFYEFHSPSDTGPRFLQTVTQTIDHMVKSWTFGVALQVLEQTATKGLSVPASAILNRNGFSGSDTAKTNQSIPDSPNHHSSMPTRKSSLPSNASQIQRRPSSEMFSPDLEAAPPSLHEIVHPSGVQEPTGHTNNRTGTEDLASWRAEVFLLARGVLQGLAKKRDWPIDCTGFETLHSIDELKEVSLDGQSPSESESEHELHSNSLVSSAGLTLDLLRQIASTFGNLKKVYEQLTDLALRHFLAANRTRSAERLFADMAILKFRSDDFASAATYFHQVAPFYSATHWTLLEGTMLELYARCLKKLDRNEDYVHVLLRLLPKYVTSREIPGLPSHSRYAVGDVDSQVADAPDLVSSYVNDLFVFSKEFGKGISVPLEDLFGGLEIEPRIWHCENKDGFQLRFKMHSLLVNEIPLQNVRVRLLESADVSPREIWLENGRDVVVKAEQSTIVVETNISVRGKYVIDRIEARSDNILFRQDELSQALLPREFRDTPAFDIANLDTPLSVFCYPCSNGLQLQVRPPTHILLAESRFFEIEFRTGWNNISLGELSIRSGTAGLRIKLLDAEFLGGNSEVASSPQPSTIQFSILKADSCARLKIPYTLEDDANSLNFKLDLQYTTDNGNFRYIANTSLPSILPVSVNVQDMFRDASLFSRFTIVPATLVPLRVLDCRIDNCDTYEVIPAVSEPVVMDIFPRQPASLLYKFVRRNHHLEPLEKPLAFTMSFRCLDEEALSIIEERFARDIMNSEFHMFRQLLAPQILAKFRVSMTASDLETIGLVRELRLPTYEEVGWDATLLGLGRNIQNLLKEWLKSWQQTNAVLPLPEAGADDPSLNRQIVIPVDIPQIKVVHTAELRVLGNTDRLALAAVGQPLVAELRIKHTQSWRGRKIDGASNPTRSEKEGQSLEFSYEIHANPEVWLIGGKRRGNFQARENEVNTFPIMLLPQRQGHLLFPGLDIKAFELQASPSGVQEDSTAAPLRKQVQSELDYRNHGESILVLPDLKTTTVSLDPGGPGGGSWLVESERRIELANV